MTPLQQAERALEQFKWYVDRYGDSRKDQCYVDGADAALAALRAYRESQPGTWRGIESAPRDPQKEERILAFNSADKKQYVIWATYEGWTDGELDDDGGYSCWGFSSDFLTHWMPLPPPPAQEGGAA